MTAGDGGNPPTPAVDIPMRKVSQNPAKTEDETTVSCVMRMERKRSVILRDLDPDELRTRVQPSTRSKRRISSSIGLRGDTTE